MKTSLLLPLALWAASGVLAWEDKYGKDCKWYGTAPFCGDSKSAIGDEDPNSGEVLYVTTEDQSSAAACFGAGWPSERPHNPCEDDYGHGCITGYKRMWCKNKPTAGTSLPEEEPEGGLDGAPAGEEGAPPPGVADGNAGDGDDDE